MSSPQFSDASSVLSPLLQNPLLTSAAGFVFLSLSSCGVGASSLHEHAKW